MIPYLCANPIFHSRMKHMVIDYHFVRNHVSSGSFRVSTVDQLVDVLTKPLSCSKFVIFRSKKCVSDGSSILRGPHKDMVSYQIKS